MGSPRTARIDWGGRRGWLVVFPNNVAFACQDDVNEYTEGLPAVWHPFVETTFKGEIVEWFDGGTHATRGAGGPTPPAT